MKIRCRKCRATYNVSESRVGTIVTCKKCSAKIRIVAPKTSERARETTPNSESEQERDLSYEPPPGAFFETALSAIACWVIGCGIWYLTYVGAAWFYSLPIDVHSVAQRKADQKAKEHPGSIAIVRYTPGASVWQVLGGVVVLAGGLIGLRCIAGGINVLANTYCTDPNSVHPPD